MLVSPSVTGPGIKTVSLNDVSADTSFTLPAYHYLEKLIIQNTGTASATVLLAIGGNDVGGFAPTVGAYTINNLVPSISDSDQTVDVTSSDWTGMDLNITVVLIDISV